MTRYATFHDLAGQSVFITGGGSGIGAALTEGFVEQGAQGRLRPALRRHRLRRGDGGEARHARRCSCPATSPTSPRCRRAMAQAAEAHGPITVLVNNAANDPRHPIEGYTVEEWDRDAGGQPRARTSSPRRRRCRA